MPVNLLLKCNDIEQTLRFYIDVLRFDVPPGTVSTVRKAGSSLIFSTGSQLGTTPRLSGTVYFFIPQVEQYYNSVKDEVEVLWPLQEMHYGTFEFGIADCNGYHLAFAEDRQRGEAGIPARK